MMQIMTQRIQSLGLCLGLGLAWGTLLQAEVEERNVAITKIYAIDGFDSNDVTEIGVYGYLPSNCYQIGDVSAKTDVAQKSIEVTAKAYYQEAGSCITMMIPFFQVIKLGILPEGDFKIVSSQGTGILSMLKIKQAILDQTDDYLYAPVQNAELKAEGDDVYLSLKGKFPLLKNGCMVFKEVRTSQPNPQTFVVQPISVVLPDDQCGAQSASRVFNFRMKVENSFKGEGILHVRTLNGGSITHLLELE